MEDKEKSGIIGNISEIFSKLKSDIEEKNRRKQQEKMERRRTLFRNIFGVDVIDENGVPRSQDEIDKDQEKKLESDFKSGKISAVVMYDHLIKKIWKEHGLLGSRNYKGNSVFECELSDYKCKYKEAWISYSKFNKVISRLRDIDCEIIAIGGSHSPVVIFKIPGVDED